MPAGSEPDGQLSVLTIGTADSGGTMYSVGSAIAEGLSGDAIRINVSASSGSSMNIQSLIDGEVDLALVAGDMAYDMYQTAEGEDLRAIAAVYVSVSNWISPVDTGAVYVHDLAGMRLGVGPQTSATELAALAALRALGLEGEAELVNCGLGAGTQLVLAGELDAVHGFTGAPIGGLEELAQQRQCRILRYTQKELDAILADDPCYVQAIVPAGTYVGQTMPVRTFGVKCLLCVDASTDEALVYQLTSALWDARDTLSQAHPSMSVMMDAAFLFEDLLIPQHEGAQRFYDELDLA